MERGTNRGIPALERHYSVSEISETWGLHRNTVERIFSHEPGVLKIVRPETLYKRRYVTLRIPESVLIRVHEQMNAVR